MIIDYSMVTRLTFNTFLIDEFKTKSEKRIYCSGIDPSIVQLDYVTLNENDKYKSWVKSNVYLNHSHDVRSILIADDQLVSAGVDTKIVFKSITDKQVHSIRKYNSMPQVCLDPFHNQKTRVVLVKFF